MFDTTVLRQASFVEKLVKHKVGPKVGRLRPIKCHLVDARVSGVEWSDSELFSSSIRAAALLELALESAMGERQP